MTRRIRRRETRVWDVPELKGDGIKAQGEKSCCNSTPLVVKDEKFKQRLKSLRGTLRSAQSEIAAILAGLDEALKDS